MAGVMKIVALMCFVALTANAARIHQKRAEESETFGKLCELYCSGGSSGGDGTVPVATPPAVEDGKNSSVQVPTDTPSDGQGSSDGPGSVATPDPVEGGENSSEQVPAEPSDGQGSSDGTGGEPSENGESSSEQVSTDATASSTTPAPAGETNGDDGTGSDTDGSNTGDAGTPATSAPVESGSNSPVQVTECPSRRVRLTLVYYAAVIEQFDCKTADQLQELIIVAVVDTKHEYHRFFVYGEMSLAGTAAIAKITKILAAGVVSNVLQVSSALKSELQVSGSLKVDHLLSSGTERNEKMTPADALGILKKGCSCSASSARHHSAKKHHQKKHHQMKHHEKKHHEKKHGHHEQKKSHHARHHAKKHHEKKHGGH